MSRVLPALILAFCLVVPLLAFAEGNPNPYVFLEIYLSPTGEEPAGACYHSRPLPYNVPLQCYVYKLKAGSYGFLAIHIGHEPGGFLGLPFGIQQSGAPVTVVSFRPCPGFVLIPTPTGVPAAITVVSETGCRHWWEHVGYLKYTCADVGATYFNIVPNADFGHNKVLNCDGLYDQGTVVGGAAQWGGTQTIACASGDTGLEMVTWGRIKVLFR